jgi:adenylate kinase
MKLVFLGPPGAGKGTQAAFVAKHLGIAHVSTGDMFRYAIAHCTPTGRAAKAYIDAGKLVPDSVTIQMVEERLQMDDCRNGFLLDGFPRSIPQAEALDQFAAPDLAVEIKVRDEKILERLTGRRVCPSCEGIFHIGTLANPLVCPVCGATLTQRPDDQPETISRRLLVYHQQTEPLIGFYKERGRHGEVSGEGAADAVREQIFELLERAR